jgi:hypothetical protein|tara:strand:+ start:3012 stop:3197 length:186 start_codon:yes stop_codon:yes gene_type:complete
MTILQFKRKEDERYKDNPHYRLGIAYTILETIIKDYDLTSSDKSRIKEFINRENKLYTKEK